MTDVIDSGAAYGRPSPTFDADLVQVGPGTPGGELFRRHWQPVAIATEVAQRPRAVRILGEDLILFRDGRGRPGLVYPRCAHRGTTLYYGKVEEDGIRCCYHGWLFDVEGHCLDQPCEAEGGRHRDRIRQPWYPAVDHYGLVFAYLGPPERRPPLPRLDILETLGDDEVLTNSQTAGLSGPLVIPCNWLQLFENVMDPWHVFVLHSSLSGTQFTSAMAVAPRVSWEWDGDYGMHSVQDRDFEGKLFRRITQVLAPNVRIVPSTQAGADPNAFGAATGAIWVVPVDDTSTTGFGVRKAPLGPDGKPVPLRGAATFEGKSWWELSEEEHQRMPGDFEAEAGQGPITLHSEEHLATSDRGVTMFRHLLRRHMNAVREGSDPPGSLVGPDATVHVEAGNFILEPS